jgi:hypothetical protein
LSSYFIFDTNADYGANAAPNGGADSGGGGGGGNETGDGTYAGGYGDEPQPLVKLEVSLVKLLHL